MATKELTRTQKEQADPEKARREANAALESMGKDEARLAEQREREALARQRLYETEHSRAVREANKETRIREEMEFALACKKRGKVAAIRRNQDPVIERALHLVFGLWQEVRQNYNSTFTPAQWAKLREDADRVKAVADKIDGMRCEYIANPRAEVEKLLKPLGLKLPTDNDSVSRRMEE